MVTVQYLNCLVPVRGRQGAAGVGVVHADPGRVDHVAAVVEILLVKHFNNWRISISNFHTSKLQNCCILASVNCGLFLKRNRFGDRDFEKRFEALKHKILSSTPELNWINKTFLKLLLGLVECVDEQQMELSFLDLSNTLFALSGW